MNDKMQFIHDYMDIMTRCKTERQWVVEAERQCIEAGFQAYRPGAVYYPGDKIYFKNREKNFAAFIVGEAPYFNILGAHIDSPRIDIKQKPIYDSNGIAYFDTHYYGGIKKYQWVTTPLALIGVVCLKDGTKVNIEIGNKHNGYDMSEDTVFCITDLLPHLDGKRMSGEHASEFVKGEGLDIIAAVASKEDEDNKDKDSKDAAVKAKLMKLLKDAYGIEETDFQSAELELVPAARASFCGFDKSLVAAYGQDDRVCAYTSLEALICKAESKNTPKYNIGIVLVDKEEIGSVGATGAESNWFEYVLRCVNKFRNLSEIEFHEALMNSNMLSSDVTAAYDPLYADAYSEHTSAKLGYGMMLSKYNGARGKCGSNDATPEYIAKIRNHFDKNPEIMYQFDEMGKVDQGGGGTIASIYCKFNMNVIDAGVPVLNMHSPMELAHVDDIVSAYWCYYNFLDIV